MSGQNGKKHAHFKTYSIASQISFIVIGPLVIFIAGGSYLAEKYNWPDWSVAVAVLLGVTFMICGLVSYLSRLIKMFDDRNGETPQIRDDEHIKLKTDLKDTDYYDDNAVRRRKRL